MKILILETTDIYKKLLVRYIQKHLLFCDVKTISTFEELVEIDEDFDLYIVDYKLPHIKTKHIDYLIKQNKKVVILTNYEEFVSSPYKDKIVEYIVKDDLYSLEYLARFIKRFHKNNFLTALIVEDSKPIRKFERDILEKIGLNVLEATNGKEGLEILEQNEIDILLTDIDMPIMDGDSLIAHVRSKKNMSEMPIVVISAENSEKFLKTLKFGANDFIKKPFVKEELIIRVNNLLEVYESVKRFKIQVQIDPLTGAFNRNFLESTLESLFSIHEVKSIAMMDIDHFKKVNDTFGHQIGDEILKHFVSTIKNTIRKTDYLVRYGGEEFLLFMPNTSKKDALTVLTKIKNNLTPCKDITYTFSAGIADEGDTLAEMIRIADERLYKAKNNGRNLIVIQ